jgi:ribulose-phosphate 3-epimerase
MKISASVYAGSQKPMQSLVDGLEKWFVDYMHIDLHSPQEAAQRLAEVKSFSNTPLDVHIIHADPSLFLPHLISSLPHLVCVQLETVDPNTLPHFFYSCQAAGIKTGIAILPQTNLDLVIPLAESIDYVMVMTTTPGKSGGTFSPEAFQQIIALQHRLPGKKIHVDGGVNNEVAYILHLLGVELLISGAYLTGSESVYRSMISLHRPEADRAQKFKVADFMVPLEFLPLLPDESLHWLHILETIEKYKQGFVLIQDKTGQLSGVFSNADLRRAFLLATKNQQLPPPAEMMNKKPFVITANQSAADLHLFIQQLPVIILFLPVLNPDGKLCGAIYLNKLTKI